MSTDEFDLVISAGRVIDPSTGIDEHLDVGIAGDRIAALTASPFAERAKKVIDAKGCLVVPGLVDLHTHIFAGGSYWGVDPAPVAWRTGVTTWVDAGSAGVYNLPTFEDAVARQRPLGVCAFLNISGIGLVGQTGELAVSEHLDPALCAATISGHRDLLVGVKCRIDHRSTAGTGLDALHCSTRAAREAGVPLMVHIGQGPTALADILAALDSGDIVTHCTTGQSMSLVDEDGRVRASVWDARARGVLFDVGHGSGAFSFAVAEALLQEGFAPDTISSDLHQLSVVGPAFDLPTTMSKFLALGLPLADVVAAATWRPAKAIGREHDCGVIAQGRRADVAVLRLRHDEIRLYDTYIQERLSSDWLECEATVVGGVVLPPVVADRPASWIALSPAQQRLVDETAEVADRRPWATRFTARDDFVAREIAGPPAFARRGDLDGR